MNMALLRKHSALLALLANVALSPATQAQLTVYSDVAGYDTIAVNPANSTGSKLTFASLPFVRDARYAGVASGLDVERKVITDAAATWALGAYDGAAGSHYVEIVSVAGSKSASPVGATRSILSTQANSLTLESALPEGLVTPFEFRIVRHWTLETLFGSANSAGLKAGSVRTADRVQLWNGSAFDSYIYQNGGPGGVGWRKVGDLSTNASATVIRPDQNVIIKRSAASDISLVVSGWVKNGQSSHEVVRGLNFVPTPFAVAVSLAASGLHTGNPATGLAAGSVVSADQVLLWTGTAYDTYYYQSSGAGGSGWRRLGNASVDAGTALIRPGSAIILRRKAASGFTWNIPQP
jgi:uncharacterized protein (TIGR02597 family)